MQIDTILSDTSNPTKSAIALLPLLLGRINPSSRVARDRDRITQLARARATTCYDERHATFQPQLPRDAHALRSIHPLSRPHSHEQPVLAQTIVGARAWIGPTEGGSFSTNPFFLCEATVAKGHHHLNYALTHCSRRTDSAIRGPLRED